MPRPVWCLALTSLALFAVAGFSPANDKAAHATLIKELHAINVELGKANPVYKGHRGSAMDHVHKAIGLLEDHIKAKERKKKPGENKKKNLSQEASDALLARGVK